MSSFFDIIQRDGSNNEVLLAKWDAKGWKGCRNVFPPVVMLCVFQLTLRWDTSGPGSVGIGGGGTTPPKKSYIQLSAEAVLCTSFRP